MRRPKGWTVYTEPSGKNWRCRWEGKYGTGQKVLPFKHDAQELALERRRDFQRMDAGLPPAPRITTATTVKEWWETYSARKKRENPETLRRFDTPALTPFVEQYGRVAIAAISEEDVLAYKYRLEDRYTGDTPQMYFRQVCAFFNAAVRAGLLNASPAKSVKKPLSGGGGGRPLTDTELSFLMPNAPEELYRTGVFSMNTRLRINEVLKLDWEWVWEIEVPIRGKMVRGLMGKIPARMLKTRSKVSEDFVFPINTAAAAVLGPRKEKGRIFPYSASTIQHQITDLRRNLKLPDDITFHCFRHTGASRYLSSDGPDGGHMEDLLRGPWKDYRSLLRYARPSPETLWRRANALSLSFSAPTQPLKAKDPGSTAPGS